MKVFKEKVIILFLYGVENNPGGTFERSGKPVKKYVKEYKRQEIISNDINSLSHT